VDVLASQPERDETWLEHSSTINWWPSRTAHMKLLLLPTGVLALLWYSLRVRRRRRVPLCRQVRRRPLHLRLLRARQFLVALFAASTFEWIVRKTWNQHSQLTKRMQIAQHLPTAAAPSAGCEITRIKSNFQLTRRLPMPRERISTTRNQTRRLKVRRGGRRPRCSATGN
jgi:hypothetical protein